MRALIALFLSVLFFSPAFAVEYAVGVSPPVLDIGTVSPGETTIVKFAIVTISPDPLVVSLGTDKGSLDFFQKDIYQSYRMNYSEEDTNSWVAFTRNPVELLPTVEDLGYSIKGAREVVFTLAIPDNAEPGYHLVRVSPSPFTQSGDTGQVGANIVAITTFHVLFYVDGDGIRSGAVLDVLQRGTSLETYFRNTGTTSITAKAVHSVMFPDGSRREFFSEQKLVAPGSIATFSAPFEAPAGTYTIRTAVDYVTGFDEFHSTITTSPTTQVVASAPSTDWTPYVAMLIILIIVIVIMIYRRRR